MNKRQVISAPAQLRALASPARQEVLDLLARMGPASVSSLSGLLKRPADGLYYHLRALERAGLVGRAGTRVRGGREEALFRSVHREPALLHDTSPGGNSTEVTAVVASMLRLGIRDFQRAAAAGNARTEGTRRELWAIRVAGWLSPSDLASVNRGMRNLRDALGKRRGAGRLYAITILLTPLDHRKRRTRGAARPAATRTPR